MTTRDRGDGRAWLIGVALILASGLASAAEPFDPTALSERDLAFVQETLESERTNVGRTLPSSGGAIVITRTETRPRICRHFTVQVGGSEQEGMGCRIGEARWQIEQPGAEGTPIPVRLLPDPERDGATETAQLSLGPAMDEDRAPFTAPLPGRRPEFAIVVAEAAIDVPAVAETPSAAVPTAVPVVAQVAAEPESIAVADAGTPAPAAIAAEGDAAAATPVTTEVAAASPVAAPGATATAEADTAAPEAATAVAAALSEPAPLIEPAAGPAEPVALAETGAPATAAEETTVAATGTESEAGAGAAETAEAMALAAALPAAVETAPAASAQIEPAVVATAEAATARPGPKPLDETAGAPAGETAAATPADATPAEDAAEPEAPPTLAARLPKDLVPQDGPVAVATARVRAIIVPTAEGGAQILTLQSDAEAVLAAFVPPAPGRKPDAPPERRVVSVAALPSDAERLNRRSAELSGRVAAPVIEQTITLGPARGEEPLPEVAPAFAPTDGGIGSPSLSVGPVPENPARSAIDPDAFGAPQPLGAWPTQ